MWRNVQSKHKRRTAAVILPVRVGSEGVALESSFKSGVKNEVLRSLCQLVNTTELALEVNLLYLKLWDLLRLKISVLHSTV